MTAPSWKQPAVVRDEHGRLIYQGSVKRLGEPPARCGECGRALVESVERDRFDSATGEQVFMVWLICPIWRPSWWRRLLSLGFWTAGEHTNSSRDMPLLGRVRR